MWNPYLLMQIFHNHSSFCHSGKEIETTSTRFGNDWRYIKVANWTNPNWLNFLVNYLISPLDIFASFNPESNIFVLYYNCNNMPNVEHQTKTLKCLLQSLGSIYCFVLTAFARFVFLFFFSKIVRRFHWYKIISIHKQPKKIIYPK